MIYFLKIPLYSVAWSIQTTCIVMKTKEGSTRIVNFITPGVGVLVVWHVHTSYIVKIRYYTPPNEVAGVYSDPYIRLFVRSSVRPSQSLIRYSSKTAEQNFMKLSGIVYYIMPYCTSYLKFLSAWFWGVPEQNKDFAIQNRGKRGVSFCEHCSQYF